MLRRELDRVAQQIEQNLHAYALVRHEGAQSRRYARLQRHAGLLRPLGNHA